MGTGVRMGARTSGGVVHLGLDAFYELIEMVRIPDRRGPRHPHRLLLDATTEPDAKGGKRCTTDGGGFYGGVACA